MSRQSKPEEAVMAGDEGRVPDVSEQRADGLYDALVFDNKLWGGRDVGDNSQFWRRATILETHGDGDEMTATVRFHHDGHVSRGHFTNGMRSVDTAPDPASVLAALLAEHPDATIAALETLLTTDEAVTAGASTIVEQDLLIRTDDSLMGALEVLIDPAREIYEDVVTAACRSLRPKVPKEDRDA